jgi:hypothetical protein
MVERRWHLASTVPVAFLAVLQGFHPAVAVPLVAGVFLPEIDTVTDRLHRSWAAHTFLLPAVAYVFGARLGVFEALPVLETAIQFCTLGLVLHLLADYVYPKEMSHEGAEWPVRPVVFSSPWGLIWLGAAWTFQWFAYLAPDFIPWLFDAMVPGVSL